MTVQPPQPALDVTKTLTGKRILFAGATGFVGKVSLSMLLHRYGEELDHVYVSVRKGSAASAERRFFEKVATAEPFEPLREKYSGEAGFNEFLKRKVSILDGDITDPLMGLTEAAANALKGKVDIVVNCAGLVSFNPPIEVSLNINTEGVRNTVQLCQLLGVPLVHMSTAFVAGNKSGLVFEDDEIVGYFPKKAELDVRDFSLAQELKDVEKLVARIRESADDHALASTFRQKAIDRLEAEGRDHNDEKTMRLAVGRERKLWTSTELVKAGMSRAEHWGWPNTYTYTKSLGEQVIAETKDLSYAIVRPSIVESALRYPFPGWNEGFTTSAPLAFTAIKGHRIYPASEKTILDIIPVDLVAGSLIGITAHMLSAEGKGDRRVFQQCSGDSNPFIATRSVELVGLYRRRYFRKREKGNRFFNDMLSRLEPVAVTEDGFNRISSPLHAKGARWLKDVIKEVRPKWGAPQLAAVLDKATEQITEFEEVSDSINMLIELFMPFMWRNRYVFRCDNTRAVYARMAPHDVAKIPWDPKGYDWRTYFLEIHLPGLEKYVFPGLEEETARRRVVHANRDLLEMFEATVHAYRHRVAFRMVQGDKQERFTYGEVHRYAGRVGSFLLKNGVKAADRVLIISENRPEWGINYFGILRAGATAVPVDPQLTETEVVNIARRADAKAILISEDAAHDLPGLFKALTEAGLQTQVHSLAQAMEGDAAFPDRIGKVRKNAAADDVASLIFTSGTTGQPKGVMLTHRNFASLVAKLAGAFEIGVGDGLLSVLPLHHTFEFSAGFLMPFSRGSEITYLDELTSDRLGDVFETGRITAMIGVPALWQLLHRKMTQEFAARPSYVEQGIKALMGAHGELRNRTQFNLGKLLFYPVHKKFGGKLKFMVSGGSALPDDVHKAFHALGFNITEGYGLTEAAPVLSVSENSNKRRPGSVGPPLPGIEIKLHEPDGNGIGEVIAKGPNVMAGYYKDSESTDAVLKDGWLYTGDLGRIDEDGRLYLVGRAKDIIIDANGKNVYPDELEDLYSVHAHIKELSIVGLPDDAGGEKVACLVVPDYKDRPRDEVRREIDEFFRHVSGEMPFYRRVKLMRFWDGELPRTSTRKVKRKVVIEELKRLDRIANTGEKAKAQTSNTPGGVMDWLVPMIAEVSGRPASGINAETRLSADLGLDSLMLTELSVALEAAGVPLPAVENLTQLQTVDDLRKVIASVGRRAVAETKKPVQLDKPKDEEIHVPESVAKIGRSLLSFGQRVLYGGVFDVQVSGRNFVPQNRNFLVVANHASHLDMGLIKVVLGDQGEKLTALAARDYFFDTPIKRAYFENFTNLIPMERTGSLRESLRMAGEALTQGFNLLIFPEGTRSTTGELAEFYPTLGYLALTYKIDVLPMYLEGTWDALPKGSMFPKNKELKVRIGPSIQYSDMKKRATGLAKSEGYRVVTRLVEQSVRELKDGKVASWEKLTKIELDPPATERSRRA